MIRAERTIDVTAAVGHDEPSFRLELEGIEG